MRFMPFRASAGLWAKNTSGPQKALTGWSDEEYIRPSNFLPSQAGF
jgi:hypothetical protein